MLKLKFDPKLDFQIEAINSIVDLFKGETKKSLNYTSRIVSNVLELPKERIFENLQQVQMKNGLPLSTIEDLKEPFNFTIEMETGTGKTYVYLRTILELNKNYGFTKFIIVVPSVAIKEGVMKNLDITREHFRSLYDNLPYTYFSYSSDSLVRVRMFGQDTNLQIMVITKDAFNKDANIIHNTNDKMGDRPIDIIKMTKPIVILDEPQKMGGEATQWGLQELDPLMILRYSATHREILNLVYKLDPYTAYNLGLVKKIEVLSITERDDPLNRKIILESIESLSTGLRAKVRVFARGADGVNLKTISLKHGDDLRKKTDNEYYSAGYVVEEINKGSGFISFANGVKIFEGTSSVNEDEIIRSMIRETIKEHFEKKKKLNPQGIKVLSLFFLNRVDDYLKQDGIVRKYFEEEFQNLTNNEYKEFSGLDVNEVQSSYFSVMKKDKSIEEDEKEYYLIMKDKERLLSLSEPVEFIFSHSALREGWDNPNVFNICTLAYSSSEIKKRQEIGRGLRLPVNQNGDRIFDKEINLLTVVTNESYQEYLEKLQTEYREDVGVEAPPVQQHKNRVKLNVKKEVIEGDLFNGLWNKISSKANYSVNIDKSKFIEECVEKAKDIEVPLLEIRVQKVRVNNLNPEEDIKREFLRDDSEGKVKVTKVLNLVDYIQSETSLTKATVYEILKKSNNLASFFKNPLAYTEKLLSIIKEVKEKYEVNGIEYYESGEKFDKKELFKEEIEIYSNDIVNVEKSVYEGVIKESDIEAQFANELDKDSRIKLFLKLPDKYVVKTPAGDYTPDWAIVIESFVNGQTKEKIYFVVETKGVNKINELRPEEQIKIKSGEKRFEQIPGLDFIAPVKDFKTFEEEWKTKNKS